MVNVRMVESILEEHAQESVQTAPTTPPHIMHHAAALAPVVLRVLDGLISIDDTLVRLLLSVCYFCLTHCVSLLLWCAVILAFAPAVPAVCVDDPQP
mgnify:CR=1 FL=1